MDTESKKDVSTRLRRVAGQLNTVEGMVAPARPPRCREAAHADRRRGSLLLLDRAPKAPCGQDRRLASALRTFELKQKLCHFDEALGDIVRTTTDSIAVRAARTVSVSEVAIARRAYEISKVALSADSKRASPVSRLGEHFVKAKAKELRLRRARKRDQVGSGQRPTTARRSRLRGASNRGRHMDWMAIT